MMEFLIRFIIEPAIKSLKQFLGIKFYQGICLTGHNAWFSLTCLRFLFLWLVVKFALRFPSLRWRIPRKKLGSRAIFRFIRNHYSLDRKSRTSRNLHYTFVSPPL